MKLNLGSGPLKVEEVDAAFTDTNCIVRLPGNSCRAGSRQDRGQRLEKDTAAPGERDAPSLAHVAVLGRVLR